MQETCRSYLNTEGEINSDNFPNRWYKMKTEKQTLDLTIQITGDSNGQFQMSKGDESLIGMCFRAENKIEESEYRQLFGRVLLQSREKGCGGGCWREIEVEQQFSISVP